MGDEDRSNFYADRLTGTQWDYAAALIDDAFLRLKVALNALGTGVITVYANGQVVGQRGAIDFRGEIVVSAEDDAAGDRLIITFPNYEIPAGLGNAAAEGSSSNLPRADHVHKRDVRVKEASADVGTRNALNFSSNFTVTDNPGADSVDIDVAGGAGGLVPLTTILLGEPEFVWDDELNLVMAEGG